MLTDKSKRSRGKTQLIKAAAEMQRYNSRRKKELTPKERRKVRFWEKAQNK